MKFVIHVNFRKKLFLFGLLNLFIWALLGVAGIYLFKSIILQQVAVILMFIPFLFIPFLLKAATKKMEINFLDDFFTVFIDKNNSLEQKMYLRDIKSYSIQFPNDRFNSIKFNFKDGHNLEYSFFQKKQHDEDIESQELINHFHSFIKKYNFGKQDFDKVLFKPSFFARNIGLAVIIGLIVFLLLGICIYAIYGTKRLPLTFLFSFILIVSIIIKRIKDLNYYRKINNTIIDSQRS